MSAELDTVPIVTDVAFRLNEQGDFFAIEFACRDGGRRAVALTAPALVKLIAAALWTAEEAGRRNGAIEISSLARARIHEHAALADAAEAHGANDGRAVILDFQIGAAPVAVRLPRATALDLAEGMVEAVQRAPSR